MGCVSRVCPVWSRLCLRNVKVSASVCECLCVCPYHKEKGLYHLTQYATSDLVEGVLPVPCCTVTIYMLQTIQVFFIWPYTCYRLELPCFICITAISQQLPILCQTFFLVTTGQHCNQVRTLVHSQL